MKSSRQPTTWATLFDQLGAVGFLALLAAFMPAIAGVVLLSNIGTVSVWLQSHGHLGLAAYIVAFAVLSGFALLPTYAQAVLGGYAFGVGLGIPAALCGFLGGAIIAYEVGRLASKDRVEGIINEKPKWRAVRDALLNSNGPRPGLLKSTGTVALLRLPPNSPFALMNLLLSAVKVPRPAYYIGTLIGMTPRTVAAVVLGSGIQSVLSKESIDNATPRWLIITGIAVSICVALLIGWIANRAIDKATRTAM
jgi:uncharacterized membrane protein YdjX (TVP38/TMEM64 family)